MAGLLMLACLSTEWSVLDAESLSVPTEGDSSSGHCRQTRRHLCVIVGDMGTNMMAGIIVVVLLYSWSLVLVMEFNCSMNGSLMPDALMHFFVFDVLESQSCLFLLL